MAYSIALGIVIAYSQESSVIGLSGSSSGMLPIWETTGRLRASKQPDDTYAQNVRRESRRSPR